MSMTINDIRILKIHPVKNPTAGMLARVSIVLCEQWEIHGFKVIRGKLHPEKVQDLEVYPPATRRSGSIDMWDDTVFCIDKTLWPEVRRLIIEAFNNIPISEYQVADETHSTNRTI